MHSLFLKTVRLFRFNVYANKTVKNRKVKFNSLGTQAKAIMNNDSLFRVLLKGFAR